MRKPATCFIAVYLLHLVDFVESVLIHVNEKEDPVDK